MCVCGYLPLRGEDIGEDTKMIREIHAMQMFPREMLCGYNDIVLIMKLRASIHLHIYPEQIYFRAQENKRPNY